MENKNAPAAQSRRKLAVGLVAAIAAAVGGIAWSAPDCGTISPLRSVIAAQLAATPSTDRSSPDSNAPGVSVT